MDHSRLISVVKEFPQVWDRNCALFREKEHKQAAWERIGQLMNQPANICRDAFKSLREKYVREREKQAMFGDKYLPWMHLDSLTFLDPHIVLRKPSINFDNDQFTCNQLTNPLQFKLTDNNNHSDFDRSLIEMVKKATPIWDRKSNGYPSKQLKYQLWRTIAQALNRDVNVCMTRWKGLREKYIRQKMKYQEGEAKWEFLDDMSFLDHVIQYRRKQCDLFENRFNNGHFSLTPIEALSYHQQSEQQHQQLQQQQQNHNDNGDDSIHDSSSGDLFVKSEGCDSVQDCSYDSGMIPLSRKRSASDNSECSSYDKRDRIDDCVVNIKTPEQVFGDLVAALLTKKTEREKNIAMIEIMKILTK